MFRALVLTFAFGLTPAFAEDIGAPILDGLPTCDGACPETTLTAMSSDLDGDGEAEYFDIEDTEEEVAVAEAEADCNASHALAGAETCSMLIDDLLIAGPEQL